MEQDERIATFDRRKFRDAASFSVGEKEDYDVIDDLRYKRGKFRGKFRVALRDCVSFITLQHADESIGHRVFYEFFFFFFLSILLSSPFVRPFFSL